MENDGAIVCWNRILTPKWVRFRHLLSGNGKIYSDLALPRLEARAGDRVLDVGCGFGETSLEFGRIVGPDGEVLGLDCTETFVRVAEREEYEANLPQVRYLVGDAQTEPLPDAHYDLAFSRFGVMFFDSAVRALRNVRRALKPRASLCLIVWRGLRDNPAWGLAKEVALEFLPPPGVPAATCGPGPFSWADEETDRAMLASAGFGEVTEFERVDADICVGRTIDEAIDYQLQVGPAGEIVREAGAEGQRLLPAIRERLAARLVAYRRDDGVFLPSSTWRIIAVNAA
jgi:SAM-dependent methyltransferase